MAHDPDQPQDQSQDQPKLIIDSDWKAQAEAERQKLAEQAKQKAAQSGPQDLPPADVLGIVQILATQALLYMGAFPDPQTGRAMVALDLAKYHVDLLGVLEEKTKGNLTQEEQQVLSQTAHELRLQYVEVSKAVEKAIAEGRAKPVDLGQAAAGQAGPTDAAGPGAMPFVPGQ
ncbi:MAG: hypothetical protein KatS3mg103_1304 [Phycisphaerales bacterium]|nr:MAG: hypothetical protein KatS3mg103_1304 [Phycisphaerales bacterium]